MPMTPLRATLFLLTTSITSLMSLRGGERSGFSNKLANSHAGSFVDLREVDLLKIHLELKRMKMRHSKREETQGAFLITKRLFV